MGRPPRCCCDRGCIIYEDDFFRRDQIPGTRINKLLGSWCEKPKTWGVDISESKAFSIIAGATAMVNIPHPLPDGSMIASMFISYNALEDIPTETGPNLPIPSPNGQVWRLIVNAQKKDVTEIIDGEEVTYCVPLSYYFAEVELVSSNIYILKLGMSTWQDGQRIEKQLKAREYIYDPLYEQPPFNTWLTAHISDKEFCVHLGVLYESCGSGDFAEDPENRGLKWVSIDHAGLFNKGYYCGMQMNQPEMYIKQYTFHEHFKTTVKNPSKRDPCPELNKNPTCDHCFCTCGNEVTGDVEIIPDKIYYRIRPTDSRFANENSGCPFLSYLSDWECKGELILDSENARWLQKPEDGKKRKICCQKEDNPQPQEFIISFHCPAIFQADPKQCKRWYLKVSGGGVWPPPVGDKPGVVGGCCLVGGPILGSTEECIILDTLCNWERGSNSGGCRNWTFTYPSLGCSCPKQPDTPDLPPLPPGSDPPPEPEPCYISVDIWW